MTYLHTSPTDPTSPLLLFHLPSFTLAELHLAATPGGNHLLTIDSATPPADETIAAFATALDSMAPDASDWLSVVTREGIAKQLPEFLHFTPADRSASKRILTLCTTMPYAHTRDPQNPAAIEQHGTLATTHHAVALAILAQKADVEFFRTLHRQAT